MFKLSFNCCFLVLSILLWGTNNPIAAETVRAKPADDFVERIQGMAHLHHTRSSYYINWEKIKDNLGALGIRYIRRVHTKKLSQPENIARHLYLHENYGIRYQFQVRQGLTKKIGRRNRQKLRENLATIARDYPLSAIARLEGPNEAPFATEAQRNAIVEYQSELYRLVKQESSFSQIPVVCFSTVNLGGLDLFDSLHKICDIGNVHSYPGDRFPLAFINNITKQFSGSKAYSVEDNMAITEQAYGNFSERFPDTMHRNAEIQAKYEQRMLLLQYAKGIEIIGRSQLADAKPDGEGNKFSQIGYLNYDGSPKPVYYAVKNLLSLLGEACWDKERQIWSYPSSFIPDALDYQLEGDNKQVEQLLFQKSDGRFFLVLWQEVNGWDNSSGKAKEIAAKDLILKLNTPTDVVKIWQPYSPEQPDAEMIPIATTEATEEISLSVPDYPIVVELIAN